MNAPISSTVVGEVLQLEGAINFANMPRMLAETAAYASQEKLPDCLAIDFDHVTDVDSSAVALILHWRRESLRLDKALRYINLPENLQSLAKLYGVEDMIQCPTMRQGQPCAPEAANATTKQ